MAVRRANCSSFVQPFRHLPVLPVFPVLPIYLSPMPLLRLTERGLYCEAGDFFVDPWEPVDRAVVTHAHGDHASWGSQAYLTSTPGLGVLRARLQPEATIRGLPYGEALSL